MGKNAKKRQKWEKWKKWKKRIFSVRFFFQENLKCDPYQTLRYVLEYLFV